METFEQVWESSRYNAWTWGYPAAIFLGALLIIRLSYIRKVRLRRFGKIAAILVFSFAATEFSAREIALKWQLRHEWTTCHADSLTEEQQQISISDGANLVLGPIIFGFQAFVALVFVAVIATLVKLAKARRQQLDNGDLADAAEHQ